MRVSGNNKMSFNARQFESPSHQGTLLSGLNALRSKGLLLDITLVAGGRHFKAHRVVLASCSDYFRAMFTDAMKESRLSEISLNGVSAEGMKYLLDYAYTSKLALSLANIQDVLSAASHVQLLAVVEACSAYLQEQLDIDNCVDVATIAETYSLRPLRKKVYWYMCSNLKQFSSSSEFHRLSFHQLQHLLECDFPVNCPERDVIDLVLRWIDAKPRPQEEKLKLGPPLLRNVRFGDLTHSQRTDLLRSSRLFKCLLASNAFLNKLWTNNINSNANTNNTTTAVISINGAPEHHHHHHHASSASSSSYHHQQHYSNTQYGGGGGPPRGAPSGINNGNHVLINSRGMEMALIKVGGFGISGVTNEITYYLPSVGKWKYLTSIPHVEQCNFGTAVLNNELYIVGGCFNQSLQENVHPFGFRYNPITNSWSTMAPMQRERCRFSLSVVGSLLFAVGGAGEGAPLEAGEDNNVVLEENVPGERYDSTSDTWSSIRALPPGGVTRRAQHAGASWKNCFFISGGLDQELVLNCLLRYDVDLDQWSSLAPLLRPRADHSMVCYGDHLYVCGGWYEDDPTTGTRVLIDTIDSYDIYRDCWRVVTSVPTPRYHAGIVVIGSWLYIVGGFHSDTTFDRASGVVECFNMETGVWTVGAHYPQDIWEHTCCTLFVPRCRDDLEVISDRSLL